MKTGNTALLVYSDGLTDKVAIENHILHPLIHELDSIKDIESPITIGKTEMVTLWLDIEQSILEGKSILFINGQSHSLVIHTQGWPQRAIKEPQIESTLKGSHQGFVETSGQDTFNMC
ncbi:Spore germination protein B1 [compost metagenome]